MWLQGSLKRAGRARAIVDLDATSSPLRARLPKPAPRGLSSRGGRRQDTATPFSVDDIGADCGFAGMNVRAFKLNSAICDQNATGWRR
jgi:hypothetical protein